MATAHATDAGSLKSKRVSAKSARSSKPSRRKPTLAERHAAMVDTTGGFFACWVWTGSTMQQNGYGQISAPSRLTGKTSMRTAHTVSWEIANSMPVPEGRIVRHVCHNPKCCNPAHLRLGTAADNRADDKAAGKKAKRLSVETIKAIADLKNSAPTIQIAEQFAVGEKTVRDIWRGQRHTDITGFAREVLKGGRPPMNKPSIIKMEGPAAPEVLLTLH